jgi:hypothetical protein
MKNSKKNKSCGHNPWDGYSLMILHNRIPYIKNSNPKIYRIYDKNGNWKSEVGEFYQEEIDRSRKEGLKVELQDNSKLIEELEADIKRVELRVEEHKKNCKGYVAQKMKDGSVKFVKK